MVLFYFAFSYIPIITIYKNECNEMKIPIWGGPHLKSCTLFIFMHFFLHYHPFIPMWSIHPTRGIKYHEHRTYSYTTIPCHEIEIRGKCVKHMTSSNPKWTHVKEGNKLSMQNKEFTPSPTIQNHIHTQTN